MQTDGYFGLGLWEVVLFAALAFIVFLAYRYIATTLVLRRMRLRRMSSTLVTPSEIPTDIRTLLEPGEHALHSMGFEYSHASLNGAMWYDGEPTAHYVLCYFHPEDFAWAYLRVPDIPETFHPFSVAFVSSFPDGHVIETHDALANLTTTEFRNVTVLHARGPSLAERWQTHREGLASLRPEHGAPNPRRAPHEEIAQAIARFDAIIDDWVETGFVVPVSGGEWRPTLASAFATTRKLMDNAGRIAKAKRHTPVERMIPPPIYADLFRRTRTARQRSVLSSSGKFLVMLGSMALFAWSFSIEFSWTTVVAFLIAVTIHEGGHILGMRLFGYRNLGVLFVPFFGAAAIGQQRDVPLHKRVIVSLLGPVPGIFIGLALVGFAGALSEEHARDLVAEVGLLFLALNYLNLLPIVPLDGGHIVQDLALSRRPMLQVGFATLGAAVLLGGGWFVGDTLLITFGVLLLLATPLSYGQGKPKAQLAANRGTERWDEQRCLEEIFAMLQDSPHAKTPFAEKFPIVTELLASLDAPTARPLPKGLLAGFYAGALLFAPIAILIALSGL